MAIHLFVSIVILLSAILPLVHLIVPPKTPVLSGFEPVVDGSNRELVCDASQPDAGNITYKWYKYATDRNGVEDWESRGPIGTTQKYVFLPVRGKYKCRASNSAGTRDSEWGDLYVYKPSFRYTVSVSPAKPAIGSSYTLNCHIHKPTGYSVNWLRKADATSAASNVAVANSKGCHAPLHGSSYFDRYSWSSCSPPSISSPTKIFNLHVINSRPFDSGYWFCKDIGQGGLSNPIKVFLQGPPGTPQVTGFPSGPVTTRTQLNLKCVASPPGDTRDWYKDGTKVTTSLRYDVLVTKESAGVYKCVARNDVGSATSSHKTLVVYYKADSVVVSSGKTSSRVREKDKFTCTIFGGNPTPTLIIYFKRSGGTPVEVTQGQARVMAKEDNQAEYYCKAKVTGYPALDMTSSRKTYNVTFPNTMVSFLNNPTAAVQVGQVKNFTCETDESNPSTYIKWYQSIGSSWRDITTGVTSSERSGAYGGKIRTSEWTVTASKAMNGKTVRCMADYRLTGHDISVKSDTTMYVKWLATELKMTEKPSAPMPAGVGISIKCETDSSNSGSPGTISWYRDGPQITSGVTPSTRLASNGGAIYISQLTFTARKEDNQAKYECKISDQASFRKDVTITVNFPPIVQSVSSAPKTVKEGDLVTLTCGASGGNPTVYNYIWYYNSQQIPNVTSRGFRISSIQYTESGEYRCRVINYSPGGVADASMKLDILYKAKWNPKHPRALTAASKPSGQVRFTLHVIANPRPTDVTWYHPNHKIATDKNFILAEVNGTYTLSKGSVTSRDYGNYTVKVTNSVGISYFVFKLLQTIAQNIPNFTITRNGKLVTAAFGPVIREYTRLQLRFCGPSQATGCSGSFFYISDPAKTNYTIHVTHETTIYVFYLDLYVGDDVVYSSGPVQSQHAGQTTTTAATAMAEQNTAMPAGSGSNGGMIAGVVVAVVILVAVVVVVVVVLHQRNMACFSGQSKPEGANQDDERTGTTPPQPVLHDPFYMNVDNRAFEADGTQQESVYENDPKQQPVKGGDENPYDEMKNPYADLNITAGVIADQTYAELK